MLKQIPNKDKIYSIINEIFQPASFNQEHPFLSACTPSCTFGMENCSCSHDKLTFHNLYVYHKKIITNEGVRTLPLQRTVMDLDQNQKPVCIHFEIKNWKCFRFGKLSAGKRKQLEAQIYHAYLPSFVPKYGRYSYRFIFSVLMDYITRKENTVRVLCAQWSIAVSTLYRWINTFQEQFRLILSEIDSLTNALLEPELNPKKIHSLTSNLLHSFYMLTGGITFMEQSSWIQRSGKRQNNEL